MDKFLWFVAGGVAGSVGTYFVTKKLLSVAAEQMFQEKLDEVDRYFDEKQREFEDRINGCFDADAERMDAEARRARERKLELENLVRVTKEDLEEIDEDDNGEDDEVDEFEEYVDSEYIMSYEKNDEGEEEIVIEGPFDCDDDSSCAPPYVIDPEDMGTLDGYKLCYISYYADGVLKDENFDIVPDHEELVGDALNHFGEYVEDMVWVRNERLKKEYEIERLDKTYAEIYGEE